MARAKKSCKELLFLSHRHSKIRKKILYPSLPSAIHPVAHSDQLPVSKLPVKLPETSAESSQSSCNSEFEDEPNTNCPHQITQQELNDLVNDLYLPKSKSELLGSWLQQWNLLAPGTKMTVYHQQSELFSNSFSKDGELFYSNNISELIHTLIGNYDSNDWRLFIDTSKKSIKAVLLYIRNILPSVHIAYSTTKETFQNLQFMLEKICYCCFLCLWDSRARTCKNIMSESSGLPDWHLTQVSTLPIFPWFHKKKLYLHLFTLN